MKNTVKVIGFLMSLSPFLLSESKAITFENNSEYDVYVHPMAIRVNNELFSSATACFEAASVDAGAKATRSTCPKDLGDLRQKMLEKMVNGAVTLEVDIYAFESKGGSAPFFGPSKEPLNCVASATLSLPFAACELQTEDILKEYFYDLTIRIAQDEEITRVNETYSESRLRNTYFEFIER